jgi:L-lactate dehydrogenase complex protein LldF
MNDFRRRARDAIADPRLQNVLDKHGQRVRAARKQAFDPLPEADDLRKRGRQVRLDTLHRLEENIARFIQQARSNGFQIHRAGSAAEAQQIVLDLVRNRNAQLIVKSKSMVSEEIRINQALESAGLKVVETDLGEFIVQLREEPPAHIVAPAVHLRLEDVAETFSQKLGIPYTTDVQTLNKAARHNLRQAFLAAQVGISGVNFGVAESGTLCLVTNEGNGRMVTTLPPVHIALMGVERIVPTLEDLALMLQLLPRSSTGQKLTSYISLIQGPRQDSDPDGSQERHIILVDNGRTRMAQTHLAESLLCIRCGACLDFCPVYQEVGGHTYNSVYPGPIGSVISPGLFGLESFGHLAKASTLCGLCQEVCPMGIDLPTLLLRVRADYVRQAKQPMLPRWSIRLYAWIMEDPRRYRWAQKLGAWGIRLLPRRDGWVRSLPPPLSAWTGSRDFPPLARIPFRERIKSPSEGPEKPVETQSLSPGPDQGGKAAPQESPVQRFARELEALGGQFHSVREEDLSKSIRKTLHELEVTSLLTWERSDPAFMELLDELQENGFDLRRPQLPWGMGPERARELDAIEGIKVGLTGAVAVIAETATLILPTEEGRSQSASLLPPVHIAVLNADRIHATMEEWLAAGGKEQICRSRLTTLISGPSRTADIEMTLTIGVHGPGRVIVFCVS